jgi:2,4-dichlorophenol 6-monooxygenase
MPQHSTGSQQIQTPVLIVGAGGAGLSAANFLAALGVPSVLIERHPSTSHLPKAHGMNARTMEIYRHHGMAEAIYPKAAPRKNHGKVLWLTSLGGDDPLDGVVFAEHAVMGGGGLEELYDLHGPAPPTHIPQMQLEPILRELAGAHASSRILFRHEFVSLTQDAAGVSAIVRDLDNEVDLVIRCRYLIAADAGKSVGPQVGVRMIGETNLQDMVVVHVSADFSRYIKDDTSVMRMIVHPRQVANVKGAQYFGALMTMGPDRWDRHAREWGVAWAYSADDPLRHDEVDVIPRIKEFLKVEVPIEVHKVSHWYLQAIVADRFRVGRVFIVGDAAHQHAPGGGLGFNSAVQDVHNLTWKLACMLRGQASDSLLDTYETERRPVVEQNAEWSLFSLLQHRILHAAMGLAYEAPAEYNEAMFRKLLADTPDGQSRRARLDEIMRTARCEYAILDKELGFGYPGGAVVDDASPLPPRDPMGHIYTPTTRPGYRLPHVWLLQNGKEVSTHDLVPLDGFLLLTDAEGAPWCAAAKQLGDETTVPIRAVRVGGSERKGDNACDAVDPSSRWAAVRGIKAGGAILVRPDGHVGFRSGPVADVGGVLRAALSAILRTSAQSAISSTGTPGNAL